MSIAKAGIQRRKNIGQWKGGRPKGSKDKKPRKRRITHEQMLRADRKNGSREMSRLYAGQ